jgi:MYXO-CTERM domain-containing protein
MAAPVTYTFQVQSGGIVFSEALLGSTTSGIAGSFAVTIYQSDGHIGESDTFVLSDAALSNVGDLRLNVKGLATASILDTSARFLDFNSEVGHIAGNGVPSVVNSDIYVEVTAVVTGSFNTTFSTKTWAGIPLPFEMSFTTSQAESSIMTGTLALAFPYSIGVPDLSMTLTLDLVVDVIATAHVVPDPAFGGLTALGLGAAGAWLRRRR